MRGSNSARTRVLAAVLALILAGGAAACRAGEARGGEPPASHSPASDPIAAEIARWSDFLKSNAASDETWTQVRQASEPVLARAGQALKDGRRLLALQRLAAVRTNLAAAAYMRERPAGQRQDLAAFEAEWRRMGGVLRADLGAPSSAALEGVRPAAARALGEAALPQVRVFYEASLEYGRNTEPASGLFYLGSAQAQRDLADFLRTVSAGLEPGEPLAAPLLRDLAPELDALEAELLAAYRPPASIDRHGEFIGASSTLKEARELNAAGLRHGALLRYLQAALRLAPLRTTPAPPVPAADQTLARLREHAARLAGGGVDHSIGRLFLELAEAELAAPAGPSGGAGAGNSANPATSSAIASDVLPRYFAALGPAPRQEPRPAPRVTVTLVRWPYT